ncbi:MAG: hypothetical protein ACKOYL_14350, partial [Actinomycetota bacterium]
PGPDLGIAIDYQGEDNFAVGIYDRAGTLVDGSIDLSGPVEDTYYVSSGAYITVRTVGSWAITSD